MAILTRPRPSQPDEENPYWMSFSDLMSGLLIIFILAAIALILELTQKNAQWDDVIAQVKKAEEERDSLVTELQRELAKEGIQVVINDSTSVITIPERQLKFLSAKYDLPDDENTFRVVKTIGEVLYRTIGKGDRVSNLDTIFVEGHTDCVPYYNLKIKHNWGLSTFRAISVWEYWTSAEGDLQLPLNRLTNWRGRPLFSVSGYADTRPLPNTSCDKTNDAELSKNRRIDLRFTVRRPSLGEYREFEEKLR
jgi:flagellar motor protein MotB